MSDPKPTWLHILALLLADCEGREEQWLRLNSEVYFPSLQNFKDFLLWGSVDLFFLE